MPELPEVETVARQLAPLLTGRTIRSTSVKDSRLHAGAGLKLSARNLNGWRIAHVARCGKQVAIELAGPAAAARWLVVHLRMTGRLLYIPDDAIPPAAQQRLLLKLDAGSLAFCDTRRFGTIALYAGRKAFQPRGLDPLSDEFGAARLGELLGDSPQEIKAWLLRQDRLVGMGNIYACEVLFRSRINPRKAAGELTRAETGHLARNIRAVLKSAIRNCGTTFSDFQDSQGRIGGYQRYLRVYGREGQACPSCGSPIQRMVQQQRSTFFCPDCQV